MLEREKRIWDKGIPTTNNPELIFKEEKEDYLIFSLGSGFYEFNIK